MRTRLLMAVAAIGAMAAIVASTTTGLAGYQPAPTYRADDFGAGRVLSILPPGANGLVNASQASAYESAGTYPPYNHDQLPKYANLLYGYPHLTDATLGNYYDDESFGVRPADIIRTEQPSSNVPVVIYRDRHDVPHIYGATVPAMAFGAGYAAAEDRLFFIDVLRHYGAGTLSAFLGPSCADERMDHDQLLIAPYTTAQANAQLAMIARKGRLGQELVTEVDNFVQGINAYIGQADANSQLMPAEYPVAVGAPPQPWQPADVIAIAGLVGGIFGKGGGIEVQNAALLQYLDRQLGRTAGYRAFENFREQNDPDAPTSIVDKSFPYEIPGKVDPSTTALPDNAAAPLVGGPTDTTPNCTVDPPNKAALAITTALLSLPKQMSNALLVTAKHSVDGHPIAVFGPQVGYFTPEVLMQEDLHAPDFAAEGASFPGTNFIVELGRGPDFAWSATSASTDVVDQRLEVICNPNGGTPAPQGTYYLYKGSCRPMTAETFQETAYTKPGGQGAPVVITHNIYLTVHGVVQGWTTAHGGRPVAVVNQRSTYNHEVDSGVGFLRWNTPSLTTSPQTWMVGAENIGYTFNWFYVDSRHIAYYVSGADPIRPSNVDPSLPTWGTGTSEWRGFLSASGHPHEIDPGRGFLTSWNNKPAPLFSAADDQYGYGPVYRVMSLNEAVQQQFDRHHGRITRANLVQAMETAATVDLSGRRVLPELLSFLHGRTEPPAVTQMLRLLKSWLASGAHRRKSASGNSQYAQAAAVAIMDQLYPTLIRALFDPLLAAGGVRYVNGLAYSYTTVPLDFANTPDKHVGSSYDAGWEGYLVKVLRQLQHKSVAQPFSSAVTARLCGRGGLASCPAAINRALVSVYRALAQVNQATNAAAWTASTATHAAGQTMPQYDSIAYAAVGLVHQPNMDWQNRPTFQQVVEFPAHRTAAQISAAQSTASPAVALPLGVGSLLVGFSWLRRRVRTYRHPQGPATRQR